MEAVAAEEKVVLVPDPDEQRKAAGKRRETPHDLHQLVVALRDVERDNQQRQRKRERRVAEGLEPRNFVTALGKHRLRTITKRYHGRDLPCHTLLLDSDSTQVE